MGTHYEIVGALMPYGLHEVLSKLLLIFTSFTLQWLIHIYIAIAYAVVSIELYVLCIRVAIVFVAAIHTFIIVELCVYL